jgi:hypothetical protein
MHIKFQLIGGAAASASPSVLLAARARTASSLRRPFSRGSPLHPISSRQESSCPFIFAPLLYFDDIKHSPFLQDRAGCQHRAGKNQCRTSCLDLLQKRTIFLGPSASPSPVPRSPVSPNRPNPSPSPRLSTCGPPGPSAQRPPNAVTFFILLLAQTLGSIYYGGWYVLLSFVLMGPVLLATILVHELGHCLAARSIGGTVDSILLWPLGGLAFMSYNTTYKSE